MQTTATLPLESWLGEGELALALPVQRSLMENSFGRASLPVRGALVSLVLVSALGVALSGCSAPGPAEAVSPTSRPTPAASSTGSHSAGPGESSTPTPAGFDRTAVYAACDAAVPADLWGAEDPLPPGPIASDSFGSAATDPYTADHTNGDPNAMYVNVQYFADGQFRFSALCVASGDVRAPQVEFIRTLD
jgi:hypothetical protein